MTILVTGGAGFIGTNFVLNWFKGAVGQVEPLINLDTLPYAGNGENITNFADEPGHEFVRGNICDFELVHRLLTEYKPRDNCAFRCRVACRSFAQSE